MAAEVDGVTRERGVAGSATVTVLEEAEAYHHY
jgi:hypothetical protein